MKKLFFTLCALCVNVPMWALQAGATAWTDSSRGNVYQDANGTGLYFYVSGTDAVLTWSEASTNNYSSLSALTIPASVTYDGVEYAVTKVGDYAFYDAATIEGEVVIPANILNLGISAFENCTNISAVTIEYSETAITETNNQLYGCSFYGCSGIKTITVNRDISVQRDSDTYQIYRVTPFTSLTGVVTVNFGVEVTKVPRNMCYGCANITTVNCYARTTPSLGTDSFNDINKENCTLHVCKSLLESYNGTYWATQFSLIENDLDDPEIESGALKDVETGLYFDVDAEGVVSIIADKLGTYDNFNLVANSDGSYTLPEKVSSDEVTYYDVTRVDASAFANSSISGHLVIPAHITKMGISAFQNCTGLTEVTYEYSATAIAEENEGSSSGAVNITFEGCSNVKTVNLNRNITLGNSTRHVGPFEYVNGVTKVTIGENVTEIPNFFVRNTSTMCLAEVYCYPTIVPTTNFDPFGNITSCTLYVPSGYKDTYSSASYSSRSYSGDAATTWGEYFTSIEEMSEELEEGTYKDIDTGLYFEMNEDGTASIYHDETGVYTDDNLVENSDGSYTLPAQVSADGATYYDVTRVDTEAFKSSSISGHLVVPANILYMGEGAFYGCTGLTEVTYEYSATELTEEYATNNGGNYSFGGCTNVTTVNLYRDITLGHSKNIVGPFCTVKSITKLNIGPRVTAIGDYMFHYAFGSTIEINSYAVEPYNLGIYAFDGTDYVINVPFGTASAYAATTGATDNHSVWSGYGTFAEMTNAFAITTNKGDDGAYATFYNGTSAVEFFNAEATVYAATSVEIEDGTGNVYINDLGSVVPEATAVLVETSEAQTMLAIATSEEVTAPTTNYLYGYDTATTITTPANYVYYMLTYGTDGSLGFYWGATDGAAFESAAHKAYLAIPSDIANKASGISIKKDAGGDTTGISSVEANDGAKVSGIYTIQGVRVSDMSQPGIYIVDGKKVLVK